MTGCTTIIGIDTRPARLQVAREVGATGVIDASGADAVKEVKEATAGVGADFSLETTGSPEVLSQAVYSTGPGGICGLVGAPPFGAEVGLDVNQMLALGRTLKAIVEGESVPDVFLPRLIALWQQGHLPVERIISYYDFDEIERAARDAEHGLVIKPVLRF
jgi:aryl-alcohol dehydrogenase